MIGEVALLTVDRRAWADRLGGPIQGTVSHVSAEREVLFSTISSLKISVSRADPDCFMF